eukprot:scaffold106734_cov63-Phaeocystis_antarctica.AAC.6
MRRRPRPCLMRSSRPTTRSASAGAAVAVWRALPQTAAPSTQREPSAQPRSCPKTQSQTGRPDDGVAPRQIGLRRQIGPRGTPRSCPSVEASKFGTHGISRHAISAALPMLALRIDRASPAQVRNSAKARRSSTRSSRWDRRHGAASQVASPR